MELDPKNTIAKFKMATVLYTIGNDAVRIDSNVYMTSDPFLHRSMSSRSVLDLDSIFANKRCQDALVLLEGLVSIIPKEGPLHFLMGRVWKRLGREVRCSG